MHLFLNTQIVHHLSIYVSFMLHLPHHPIEGTGIGVLALEFVFRTAEVIADLAEGAFIFLVSFEVVFENRGEIID